MGAQMADLRAAVKLERWEEGVYGWGEKRERKEQFRGSCRDETTQGKVGRRRREGETGRGDVKQG
jgi:hypothetical protein